MDRAIVGLVLVTIFGGATAGAYGLHWLASRITIVRKEPQ